jgi:hypothetical protein
MAEAGAAAGPKFGIIKPTCEDEGWPVGCPMYGIIPGEGIIMLDGGAVPTGKY